jgi:hypothetical protein
MLRTGKLAGFLALIVAVYPAAGVGEKYAGYGTGPTDGDHPGAEEYSPYLDEGFPQQVMTVRAFAGWDFAEADVERPDFAKDGYLRYVPVGVDLYRAPDGTAPGFIIRALRDVDGANLDRVQVVKGWLDNRASCTSG